MPLVRILVGCLLASIVLCSSALAGFGPRAGPHAIDDGVWNNRHGYPMGVSPTETPHIAYDPSRDQFISLWRDGIEFGYMDSLHSSRSVPMPSWHVFPSAAASIYEPVRDRTIVLMPTYHMDNFGQRVEFWCDVYSLRIADSVRWEPLVATRTSPNLWEAAAIYDPIGDRMIVFGGWRVSADTGVPCDDVWALTLGEHPAWTRIEPRGVGPGPRLGHSAIYDAEHGAMIVFGGSPALNAKPVADVWTLDLTPFPRWREIKCLGEGPPAHSGYASAYDEHRGRMLVTGGSVWSDGPVWELALHGAPKWSRLHPAGEPPVLYGSIGTFADPVRDRMVVRGEGSLSTLDWGGAESGGARPAQLASSQDATPTHAGSSSLLLEAPSLWRGGALPIRFTISAASGVRLALFDIGGRRIWAADPSPLETGGHEMTIATPGHVPAGVYFLRLEQGKEAITRRIVKLPG